MQDNLLRVCKCIILSLESKRSLLTPKQAGGICEEAQPVSSPRRRGNTLSWRSLRLEIDHTLRRSCRWKFDQRKFYCQKKKKKKKKKNQTPLLIHYYKLPNALHFALQDCRQLSDQGRRSPAWRLQGLTYSIVFLEKCRWTSHCWMLFSLGLILYVWTQGF